MTTRHAIVCPDCGETFERTHKQVNAAIKHSGRWACKACVMSARNKRHAQPLGYSRFSAQGYIEVKTATGWARRSRLVMEQHLGRKLLASEIVRHKNDRKDDDSIGNLVVKDVSVHNAEIHQGKKRTAEGLANIRAGYANRTTAKLNPALAVAIRMRAASGERQADIARDLRVHAMTISRTVRNQAWASSSKTIKTIRRVHILMDDAE